MTTIRAADRDRLEPLVFAVVWPIVVVLVALGIAGLIRWLDHQPGGPGRPELTWAADQAMRAELDTAAGDLAMIADRVERLGLLGRGSLAALTAREFDTLDAAIADGSGVVSEIREASVALRAKLDALPVPGVQGELRLSDASRDRYARILAAVDATNGLAESWARLAQGGLHAGRLTALLDGHDELIVNAIEAGVLGRWSVAAERIDQATALLDEAGKLRDQLQNTVEVGTLNEWLRRNRDYDIALRHLYEVSSTSPTRVTPEMRAALAAEKAAREALPRDTSNFVIIVAEIARGGLNQAVIGIEEARARLAAAVEDVADESSPPG